MRLLFVPFLAELFIIVLEIFPQFRRSEENKSHMENEYVTSSLSFLFCFFTSCLVFLRDSVQQVNAFIRKSSRLIQFYVTIYFSSANPRPLRYILSLT